VSPVFTPFVIPLTLIVLRNAQPASDFFRIPPNRAIEIGTQVVI